LLLLASVSFSFHLAFEALMNKINRKIEYALMALKYMSQKIPGELTTAKEVSDNFRTPFDATARVMQIMAQKSWLRSEQGAFGGYQITKDLSKVNMYDLIEIIDGPTAVARCLHKDSPCEIQTTCNIVSPISKLNFKLSEFYQSLNLKDLLVNHG
jgi:Rrf2 family nitric oxide-sensitive transcriptional repressor